MKKLIGWLAMILSSSGSPHQAVSQPELRASDTYKLYTNLSGLPTDLGVWIGKVKGEALPDLKGIEYAEEEERGKWLSTTDGGENQHNWRRLSFMITWVNNEEAYLSRPVRISFNADSGIVWYVHLPVKAGSKMPKVGPIAAGDTFQTCVAKLGRPVSDVQTAPVTREASWQIGTTTYRITYYSEAYADFDKVFGTGEIDLVAAYRKDLAPAGFDDKSKVYDPSKGW